MPPSIEAQLRRYATDLEEATRPQDAPHRDPGHSKEPGGGRISASSVVTKVPSRRRQAGPRALAVAALVVVAIAGAVAVSRQSPTPSSLHTSSTPECKVSYQDVQATVPSKPMDQAIEESIEAQERSSRSTLTQDIKDMIAEGISREYSPYAPILDQAGSIRGVIPTVLRNSFERDANLLYPVVETPGSEVVEGYFARGIGFVETNEVQQAGCGYRRLLCNHEFQGAISANKLGATYLSDFTSC